MYRTAHDSLHSSPDVAVFVETVRSRRDFFVPGKHVYVARAPGRLDVMGGIADYSASLVLELPIAEAAFAALQRDTSRKIRIVTLTNNRAREPVFEMSLDDFEREGAPIDYHEALKRFQSDMTRHWAAYVAGAFLVLARERG